MKIPILQVPFMAINCETCIMLIIESIAQGIIFNGIFVTASDEGVLKAYRLSSKKMTS